MCWIRPYASVWYTRCCSSAATGDVSKTWSPDGLRAADADIQFFRTTGAVASTEQFGCRSLGGGRRPAPQGDGLRFHTVHLRLARQVVSSSQQGADDYVATCEDGNRYRVFVNAEGRVIVQKLD